ncbi:hypothetical protein KY328_03400 [Candidatus Woesearchaeota archaeon]|nr:hypothetical protein [Candidatus Woesearchaeota archaeon]MBW3021940.1 hypothetical protein [Candidatus Woesearchaeota archaeon]
MVDFENMADLEDMIYACTVSFTIGLTNGGMTALGRYPGHCVPLQIGIMTVAGAYIGNRSYAKHNSVTANVDTLEGKLIIKKYLRERSIASAKFAGISLVASALGNALGYGIGYLIKNYL